MNPKLPNRNQFVYWLTQYISKEFTVSDWNELGYSTGCKEIIIQHPRLLKSLNFGDDDYGACVSDVIEQILDKNFDNIDIILKRTEFIAWLSKNNIEAYNELFGTTNSLINSVPNFSIDSLFQLEKYIVRVRNSVETDPELAIGSTKELLETVLKTILSEYSESKEEVDQDDMPKLLKRVQKALKISPEDSINKRGEETIKKILNSLGQVVNGINELRNIYGSGHGRVQTTSSISARHARLAVNCGAAIAIFLMETFEMRKNKKQNRHTI